MDSVPVRAYCVDKEIVYPNATTARSAPSPPSPSTPVSLTEPLAPACAPSNDTRSEPTTTVEVSRGTLAAAGRGSYTSECGFQAHSSKKLAVIYYPTTVEVTSLRVVSKAVGLRHGRQRGPTFARLWMDGNTCSWSIFRKGRLQPWGYLYGLIWPSHTETLHSYLLLLCHVGFFS
jgi:hypothetical protein